MLACTASHENWLPSGTKDAVDVFFRAWPQFCEDLGGSTWTRAVVDVFFFSVSTGGLGLSVL